MYLSVFNLAANAFCTYFFALDNIYCILYLFAFLYLMAAKFSIGDEVWIQGAALKKLGYER